MKMGSVGKNENDERGCQVNKENAPNRVSDKCVGTGTGVGRKVGEENGRDTGSGGRRLR